MEIVKTTSLILLTISETVPQQSNMNNIIGIGGILATIITGIISSIVTWRLTLRSIGQYKLSYRKSILSILSSSVQRQHNALNDISFVCGKEKLKNPCLLLLEIENTGNKAIVNPPIKIRAEEGAKIIPGYFQDVPPGYENKWTMESEFDNCCKIPLEHINPKQVVKVCLIIDGYSESVVFECPMQDIIIQEKSNNTTDHHTNINSRFNKLQKITIVLFILTIVLFASLDFWLQLLFDFYIPAPSICIALFILSTLVISILLNVFGRNKLDNYVFKNKVVYRLVKSLLFILSITLTLLILYNVLIVNFYIQTLIAIFVIAMLSYLIHLVSID